MGVQGAACSTTAMIAAPCNPANQQRRAASSQGREPSFALGPGRRISQCYLPSTSAAASPRLELDGVRASQRICGPGPCPALSVMFPCGQHAEKRHPVPLRLSAGRFPRTFVRPSQANHGDAVVSSSAGFKGEVAWPGLEVLKTT